MRFDRLRIPASCRSARRAAGWWAGGLDDVAVKVHPHVTERGPRPKHVDDKQPSLPETDLPEVASESAK